jgi:hypothetical protein
MSASWHLLRMWQLSRKRAPNHQISAADSFRLGERVLTANLPFFPSTSGVFSRHTTHSYPRKSSRSNDSMRIMAVVLQPQYELLVGTVGIVPPSITANLGVCRANFSYQQFHLWPVGAIAPVGVRM